jgi:hypothetical protein
MVAGCAAEPPEPAVDLGTGEVAFQPLVEGGEILVVHGPQGGYHLLGSVRTVGLVAGDPDALSSPDNPTVTFRAWLGDVDLTRTGPYVQGLDPRADDPDGYTHEMVGRLCILDIADDDDLAGQTVRFEVEVAAADGVTRADARELVVQKDPRNL